MNLFLGNEIELLFEMASASLKADMKRGVRKRILVPSSSGLGEWFLEQLLVSKEVGFHFGFRSLSLESALFALLSQVTERPSLKKKLPSREELVFWLLFCSNSPLTRPLPLLEAAKKRARYFQLLSELEEERALALIEEMEQEEKVLWEKSFGLDGPFTTLYSLEKWVMATKKRRAPLRVDLFGLPLCSKVVWRLFETLSPFVDLHCWLFSPSAHFWEDHFSMKERFLKNSPLPDEGPPILANWGMAARKMAQLFNEDALSVKEGYRITKGAQQFLSEFYWDDLLLRDGTNSDLEKIQAEMVLFASQTTKKEVPRDASIQFHESPSEARSIEILYDWILEQLTKDRTLVPSDFLILAPDLTPYIPWIEAVFGASSSLLPFHIAKGVDSREEEALSALVSLIDLAFGKWEKETLLSLLHNKEISSSKILEEEMAEIEKMISPLALKGDFVSLEKLLQDLLVDGLWDQENGIVTQGNEELYFSFLTWLREVEATLSCNKEEELPFSAWLLWLEKASHTLYKDPSLLDPFFRELELRAMVTDPLLSLSFFGELLQALSLERKGRFIPKKGIAQLLFSTLSSHALVPAQVIVIIGANEGVFPRREPPLRKRPKESIFPSEEERLLFLEALFSARIKIAYIYEKMPSSLIEELIRFLGKGVTFFHHPEKREDPTYFQMSSSLHSFSLSHFEEAACDRKTTSPLRKQREKKSSERASYTLFELEKAVKNPLALFLKENYEISIFEPSSIEPNPFMPTPAEIFRLRKLSLFGTEKSWHHYLQKRELFLETPSKPFWNAFVHEISQKSSFLEKKLEEEEAKISVDLFGRRVELFTLLERAPSCSLVIPQRRSLSNLIKKWPLYLFLWIFTGDKPEAKFSDETLFAASSSCDPAQELSKLLQFYEEAKYSPFPILSEWVEAMVNNKEIDLDGSNPLWHHIEEKMNFSEAEKIAFHQKALDLYAPLLEAEI